MLLLSCLVQPVDDRILPLLNIDSLHHLVVLESYLSGRHISTLLEIRPWRIDHRDIVLLVAFNRVGLGELRAVREQVFGDRCPCLSLVSAKPEVDMRGG